MLPIIHISLPSYAVMAVLGAFVAVIFLYFRIEKYDLLFTDFLKLFVVCIIFGFIGSRAIFVISRLPWLIPNLSISNVLSIVLGGGFVFYGGLLGVLLGVCVYCKKRSLDTPKILNMITPAIPLFHSIGRVGCLLSGCCYGIELRTPVSVLGVVTFNRVPTQLIEAIFELVLFIIILILSKKKGEFNTLRLYMITYAIFRFIIEFFRGDTIRGFFLGFSTSQIISVCIIVFYIIKAIRSKNQIQQELNYPIQ